ncbi:hypothetical protein CMI37_27305 [Candidatus Pacearchaeota archaeon]|nr:hypothetical protein [Candidatus Pacearchaeota archaeon]|tara:strand:- start:1063 stop:1251 length:189 start_codon:yes stop_codon:yes gene_type:complete
MEYRKIIKRLQQKNKLLKDKLELIKKKKTPSGYTEKDIDFIVNSYLELAQDMNNVRSIVSSN